MTTATLELRADMDNLKPAISALRSAIGASPERARKARDFLFGRGEKLSPGLIEFSCVTATGTDNLTVRLDVADQLREFTAALAAGEFDRKVGKKRGHGGLRG